MSVNFLRTQQKSQGGFTSNTVGYLNPVWYTFRQYTGTFTAVSEPAAGTLRLATPSTAGIAIGSKVRFAGGPYNGVKTGTVSAFVANTSIDLTGAGSFFGTATGYFTDLSAYRNLGVETELYDYLTTYTISRATSFWQTRPNLEGTIDIQSELRSLFYAVREIPAPLTPPTFLEHLTAGRFKMRFRETWLDSSNVVQKGPYTAIEENAIGIAARRAIREAYGNNMIDYVLKSVLLETGLPVLANPGFDGSLNPWLSSPINSDELPWGWSSDKAFTDFALNSVTDPYLKSISSYWSQRAAGFINPSFLDIDGGQSSTSPTAGYAWERPAGGGGVDWKFNGQAQTTTLVGNTQRTYRLGQSNALASAGANVSCNVFATGGGAGDVTMEVYDKTGTLRASATQYFLVDQTLSFVLPIPAGNSDGVFFQIRNDGPSRSFILTAPSIDLTQPAWSGATVGLNPVGTAGTFDKYANYLFNQYGTAEAAAGDKKMKLRVLINNTGTVAADVEAIITTFSTRYDQIVELVALSLFYQSFAPGVHLYEVVKDFPQALAGRLGLRMGVYSGDGTVNVTVEFFGQVHDMEVLYQTLSLPVGTRTMYLVIAPSLRQFTMQVVAFDALPTVDVLATVTEFRTTAEQLSYSLDLNITTARSRLGLRFQGAEGDNIAVDFCGLSVATASAALAPGLFHTRFQEPLLVSGPLSSTKWEFTKVEEAGAGTYIVYMANVPPEFGINQPVRLVGGQFSTPGYISAVAVGYFDLSGLPAGLGGYLGQGDIYNLALAPSPLRRSITFSVDTSSELSASGAVVQLTFLDNNRRYLGQAQGQQWQMDLPASIGAGLYSFLIEPGIFPAGTAFVQAAITRNPSTSDYLTEIKTLRVEQACSPFVVVEWENALGGFDQWLFSRRIFTRATSDTPPAITERYDPDIENSQGNIYRDESGVQLSMSMADEFVPFDEVPWLDEVKRSKTVSVIFENGVKTYCVPTSDTTAFDTRTSYVNFALTLRLPAGFNPRLIDSSI